MDLPVNRAVKWVGRILSVVIVTSALALGLVVIHHTDEYPRTDDSEILANFIGIAPQVEGPILRLNVHDNQLVKQGDLLFEIDDRPYRYALERAISEQATLEGQISDEGRKISALVSAVSVSQANIQGTEADVSRSGPRSIRSARTWQTPNKALPAPKQNGHTRTTTCIESSRCWLNSLSRSIKWIGLEPPRLRWRRLSNRRNLNCVWHRLLYSLRWRRSSIRRPCCNKARPNTNRHKTLSLRSNLW